MAYLAPLREASDVPMTIASTLGCQFSGGRTPEQQLCDFLRAKELLLCLDNFEHLLDCAPLVSQLLAAAPKLRIVITSHEPLRIQGEQTYVLEPLPLEAGAGEYSDAELLFADRASLVNRSFILTPEISAEVRHFCEHMAGIPLAIEMAAAWMDTFTLAELHDELTNQQRSIGHRFEPRQCRLAAAHRQAPVALFQHDKRAAEDARALPAAAECFRSAGHFQPAARGPAWPGSCLR
jgi:predicted ATPase